MTNYQNEILYLMAKLSSAYEEAVERQENETDPKKKEYFNGKADGLLFSKCFAKDAYEGWYHQLKAMDDGRGSNDKSPSLRKSEEWMASWKEEESNFLKLLQDCNREWLSGLKDRLGESGVAGLSDEQVRLEYLRLVMGKGLESEIEKRLEPGENEKT